MKFKQLNIGQQFEYQGQTYIKTTPLIAKDIETGDQKLIPHYANLITDTPSTGSLHKTSPTLASERVTQAISLHKHEFSQVMETIKEKIDDDISILLNNKMEKAYRDLYRKLEIDPD